jgi:ribulose-phosphate 3-epimerase
MPEIIPAILTDSEEELVRLVHILERAGVKRAHLDILDGTLFGDAKTVEGYDELSRLASKLEWDVHLMVANPAAHIARYGGVTSVKRFIAHVEATGDIERVAQQCADSGHEFWAALNPDTPLGKLTGLSCHLDGALCMTVHAGAQGRPFIPAVLEGIIKLKASGYQLPIMVDGGVTPDTAPQCVAAGASVLVAGSFVVRSPDPAAALKALEESVR